MDIQSFSETISFHFLFLFIISISFVPTICEIFSLISAISGLGNVLTVAHIARKKISKLLPRGVCCIANGVANTTGFTFSLDLFFFSIIFSSSTSDSFPLGCLIVVEPMLAAGKWSSMQSSASHSNAFVSVLTFSEHSSSFVVTTWIPFVVTSCSSLIMDMMKH